MQIANLIKSQISKGNDILLELKKMRETSGVAMNIVYYINDDVEKCRKLINTWQMTSKEILISRFGETHRYVSSFEGTISKKDRGHDYQEEFQTEVNNGLSVLESINESLNIGLNTFTAMTKTEDKSPMVFISHSSKDKDFANALVNLLESLGMNNTNIFCSSVNGYGIPLSENIFDTLRSLFEKHNLFVLFIHSPRYYESPVSLNEMGAAWVLKSDFCSLLTSDMEFNQMTGVVNNNSISIKVDSEDAPAHLNELKDKLASVFNLKSINGTQWERKRKEFLDSVKKKTKVQLSEHIEDQIEINTNESKSIPKLTNLFESHYIPAFNHIFELLDLEHFSEWAYKFICGYTILSKSMYINLDRVVKYIKSRPKHTEYASWDSLMRNLSLLIKDFILVFSQHDVMCGKDAYGIEKFYKIKTQNPNYDIDLEAYNQHICLVSDVVYEMARLCNLILSKIREQYPEYKKEFGVIYIYDDPDLLYKENEISDAPYPGIEKFIKDRLTREPHCGDNPRIDIDEYEKS